MIQCRSPVQVPKPKKEPRPIIRSPAFRRKFEDGMPHINHRAIPLHNLYTIEMNKIQIVEEKGLQFWGCVMPQPRKFKTRKIQTSHLVHANQTRGQNMFKSYMRRRPSLILTPRSYDSSENQSSRMNQTVTHEFNSADKKFKVSRKTNPQTLNDTIDSFMLTNQGDIAKMNSKSLYEMSPEELKTSIMWKRRFLQIFTRQMGETKSIEYAFKPYKS